jgi:hypothetical protein
MNDRNESAETRLAIVVALDALAYLEIMTQIGSHYPMRGHLEKFQRRAQDLLSLVEPETDQLVRDKVRLNAAYMRSEIQ